MDERIKNLLVCPSCRSKLKFEPAQVICLGCAQRYPLTKEGQVVLIVGQTQEELAQKQKEFKLSSALHQFSLRHQKSRLWKLVKNLLRPLTATRFVYIKRPQWILNTLFPENESKLVIDIGAGGNPIHPKAITVDVYPESGSQIIAQAERLPFPDNSLDGVVLCGVIEHLKKPWLTAQELIRVLKPGGYLYAEMPLLQGIHPNPYDEQRFTPDGLETIFQPLITLDKGVDSGPGTVLAHLLPNWLAMLFSFRSKFLFEILMIFFSLLTFPIKYTDFILLKHPAVFRAPFAVYYFGKKGNPT